MSDTPQTINGALLRLKREANGWLVSDMATRACMSVKQIRQLEEGGSGSFYSESVKFTSAKKVGAILGLTPDDVFGVPKTAKDVTPDESHLADDDAHHDNAAPSMAARLNEDAATSSEANPPAVLTASVAESEAVAADAVNAASVQKNKTPLAAIAALFVAALAVAAWMRPEAETVAVEPPPPLQTLPADTPDSAASAASSAESVASAMVAETPASATTSAVRPAPAASGPVTAPPAVSTPTASKPL